MKKIAILAFAIAISSVFASCGNNAKTETTNPSADSTTVQVDTCCTKADSTAIDTSK
jgi:hypothetical protein